MLSSRLTLITPPPPKKGIHHIIMHDEKLMKIPSTFSIDVVTSFSSKVT